MNSKELLERADQRIAEVEDIKKTRKSIEDIERLNGILGNAITIIILQQGNIEERPDTIIDCGEYKELKGVLENKLDEFLQRRIIKLEHLLGPVQAIPLLSHGKILVVGQDEPVPHLLPSNTAEVVIPDPIAKRKPATVNPEFEAAVQNMEQSTKKPDPVKKDPIPKNPLMTEEEVKRLYQDEGKSMKEIAEYFGVTKSNVNNFIYLHKLSRKKMKDDDFLDAKVEQRRKERP